MGQIEDSTHRFEYNFNHPVLELLIFDPYPYGDTLQWGYNEYIMGDDIISTIYV